MHQNKLWLAFLGVLTAIVLWYTLGTVLALYEYNILSAQTEVQSVDWMPIDQRHERYALQGRYTFTVDAMEFAGETTLSKPLFRNTWAAEQAIEEYRSRSWSVWYAPGNPERSSLQKSFPTKQSLSTVVLWGLWGYFVWLGFYVTRYRIG